MNGGRVPSEATFCLMTEHEPEQLVTWVESGTLKPTDLTFAAEALGRIEQPALVPRARRLLQELLGHEYAAVREGAIYGLSLIASDDLSTRLMVERLAAVDPSQGVRMAASGAFDIEVLS